MTLNLSKSFTCLKCPIHTPKEAYYFFPSPEDEYVINQSTKKPRRLIFEKVNSDEYLPYEKEKYNEFMNYYIKNHQKKFSFPEYWTRTETMKCLQSTGFEMDKCIEKVKAQLEYPMPKIIYEEYEEISFMYMD